jgi:hypothetical protein
MDESTSDALQTTSGEESTKETHAADRLVKAFVLERSTTFKELDEIRAKVRKSIFRSNQSI